MNPGTLTTIIVAACGAMLVGMAGLIKTMIISRLDDMQRNIQSFEPRLVKLEIEHKLLRCRDTHGESA